MIDLRLAGPTLTEMAKDALKSFEDEHPGQVWSAMAFDAAPAFGIVGINFDTPANSDSVVSQFAHNGPAWYGEDPFGRFSDNCADFEFSRYRELEFPDWQNEFMEHGEVFCYVTPDGRQANLDMQNLGNEGFNRVIFQLLQDVRRRVLPWVARNAKHSAPLARFGIQMCDSEYVEFAPFPTAGKKLPNAV